LVIVPARNVLGSPTQQSESGLKQMPWMNVRPKSSSRVHPLHLTYHHSTPLHTSTPPHLHASQNDRLHRISDGANFNLRIKDHRWQKIGPCLTKRKER